MPPNVALNTLGGGVGTREGWTTRDPSWLQGNAYTDTTLTNIENGLLFLYNRAVGIYKCPADNSSVRDLGRLPRTRSVSLSMYMNRWPNPADSDFDKCWHRLAGVRRPGPAQALAVGTSSNRRCPTSIVTWDGFSRACRKRCRYTEAAPQAAKN